MRVIKKSSSTSVMVLVTSSTDHISGLDGLTLSVSVSKNGGDFEVILPDIAGKSNGWYKIDLDSSYTDTIGDLIFHISATGADPTDVIMNVAEFSMDEIGLMVSQLHVLHGMTDIPSTANKLTGKWIAGDIELDMTGDGVNILTIQKH